MLNTLSAGRRQKMIQQLGLPPAAVAMFSPT
jgi:hypothetical protein